MKEKKAKGGKESFKVVFRRKRLVSYQGTSRMNNLRKTSNKAHSFISSVSLAAALSLKVGGLEWVSVSVNVEAGPVFFLIPSYKGDNQFPSLSFCFLNVTHSLAQLSAWALTWLTRQMNLFTSLCLFHRVRVSR